MTRYIRKFDEIGKHERPLCGGKGSSLADLFQKGFNVPDGFIILTTAFKKCDRKNGFSHDLAEEIYKYFDDLDTEYVAVRSSASAEDGTQDSWAGQFDTYLYTSRKDLLKNIKKCWASLNSPKVLAYCSQKKIDSKKNSMAVVVQKMITSEVSGVAFSVHPTSQNKNEILIETAKGLGEAVVSGQITPNQYVIDRSKKIILKRKMVQKNLITDEEILSFNKIILKIEKDLGYPVDIEWSRVKNQFYILQCRPITTLPTKLFDRDVDWVHYLTRPFTFFGASLWQSWYDFPSIKKILGKDLKLALFFEEHRDVVRLYRDKNELNVFKKAILDLILKRPKVFIRLLKKGLLLNKKTEKLLKLGQKSFADLGLAVHFMIDLALHSAVLPNLGWPLLEKYKIKNLEMHNLCEKLRMVSSYPKFIDKIIIPLAQKRLKKIGVKNLQYLSLITLSELLSGRIEDLPSRVLARKNGKRFIYQKISGKENIQWVTSIFPFIQELENIPVHTSKFQIKGNIAYPGKVRGKARVILHDKNSNIRFHKGDILVSIHSSPTLMPFIVKSSAIVTDEGGIACHAAIISRELEKPCIMGTKIATSIIKDGDLIEVDANRGVVTILK